MQPATSPQPELPRSSPTSRAVVCLSGGMDSAVCAAIAALEHETYAIHFSYGQRTEQRELHSARAIASELKLAKFLPISIDLFGIIGGSALTDSSIAVPQQAEDAPLSGPDPDAIGASIPVTYVPFRNAHFLSSAVSWAEVLGAEAIYIGAVEQDSSGYPDCRPAYYEAFQQLIRTGTRHGSIRVETPLISMRKHEIVRRGLELRAPFHVTWSCYTGTQTACGTCESCILRLRAFAEAGVDDPIPYATDWRQTANAPRDSI